MHRDILRERLRTARKDTELTQIQVADLLQVDKSTVAKYETGGRLPDIETLVNIADLYGVSIDLMVGRAMRQNPNVSIVKTQTNTERIARREEFA